MQTLKLFTDRKGIKWEVFIDSNCHDNICLKPVDEEDMNSNSVFHFNSVKIALEFVKINGKYL